MVPLKHLMEYYFWRTFEMPLINCKITLTLPWSKNCFLVAGTTANQEPKFKITDTKPYVPVVTLSIQDNIKLLKQLESGFKRTIIWNKYQSKITEQVQNRYLEFLIDPSLQGVNKLLVSSFEDKNVRKCYKQHFLPTV